MARAGCNLYCRLCWLAPDRELWAGVPTARPNHLAHGQPACAPSHHSMFRIYVKLLTGPPVRGQEHMQVARTCLQHTRACMCAGIARACTWSVPADMSCFMQNILSTLQEVNRQYCLRHGYRFVTEVCLPPLLSSKPHFSVPLSLPRSLPHAPRARAHTHTHNPDPRISTHSEIMMQINVRAHEQVLEAEDMQAAIHPRTCFSWYTCHAHLLHLCVHSFAHTCTCACAACWHAGASRRTCVCLCACVSVSLCPPVRRYKVHLVNRLLEQELNSASDAAAPYILWCVLYARHQHACMRVSHMYPWLTYVSVPYMCMRIPICMRVSHVYPCVCDPTQKNKKACAMAPATTHTPANTLFLSPSLS